MGSQQQFHSKTFQPKPAPPIQTASLTPRPFGNTHDTPTSALDSTPNLQTQLDLLRRRPSNLHRITPDIPKATIQPKLTVGAPNDQYEQEADRVADQVMSMPDRPTQPPIQREAAPEEEELQTKPLAASITPLLQREAMPEEEELQTKASENSDIQRMDNLEEEELQTKPGEPASIQRVDNLEEEEIQTKPVAGTVQREDMPEEEEIQTKPLANTVQRQEMPEAEEAVQTKPSLQRAIDGSLQAGSNLESRLNSSKGGGSPLPQDVKGFMESRFRTDFSQVRAHTDSESVQMNRDLNAQAFTHKQDVYFGAGKTPGKDALTAHELTHVVQQTGAVQRELIQRDGDDDNKLVDFDHELELPIELKDKKGQTVFTQAAELTLSLNTRALYTAKSSKFKLSFGKLKLATVVSAASEMDGGVASTNTETAAGVGASATIFSARITRPSLFLPAGSELKLGGAWSGTFNFDGSYESKTKPKLVFIIPITKGQYEKSLEVEATPGGGMFKFTGTF